MGVANELIDKLHSATAAWQDAAQVKLQLQRISDKWTGR